MTTKRPESYRELNTCRNCRFAVVESDPEYTQFFCNRDCSKVVPDYSGFRALQDPAVEALYGAIPKDKKSHPDTESSEYEAWRAKLDEVGDKMIDDRREWEVGRGVKPYGVCDEWELGKPENPNVK